MNNNDIMAVLAQFVPPHWAKDLVSTGAVRDISLQPPRLVIKLVLPFVDYQLDSVLAQLDEKLCQLSGAEQVEWQLSVDVATLARANDAPGVTGVRNIIAISSGKGGVGKSTTAVNLALALKRLGARVGILDADVYGPSIPMMLGVMGAKPAHDGKTMAPIPAHGLLANSIGFLVGAEDATIWRGPGQQGVNANFARNPLGRSGLFNCRPATGHRRYSNYHLAKCTHHRRRGDHHAAKRGVG